MKSLKIPQQMGLIGKPKAVHRILHIEIPLEQHGAPHLLIAHEPCKFFRRYAYQLPEKPLQLSGTDAGIGRRFRESGSPFLFQNRMNSVHHSRFFPPLPQSFQKILLRKTDALLQRIYAGQHRLQLPCQSRKKTIRSSRR